MTKLQSLRGMFDLLPSETMRWQKVEALARVHFRRARVQEIRTPLLEMTELFSRGIGESSDVVGKEMYSFLDRGDRSCTMRPEGTASVVRAAIENGLFSQGSQRLWYLGPMFRYERPQAGRQRQFHQLGIEFFGLDSVLCDAEVISIAWDLLRELGLRDIKLEINTLGDAEDRARFRKDFVLWLEKNFQSLDPDSQKRIHSNPLRVLDSKNKDTQKVLADAPSLIDAISDTSRERFASLKAILEKFEIPFVVNPRLVRGLDYYCHTAFEITCDQLGSQATVCGGGRYDGLSEQLGGPKVSSIGWAIGLERLLLLLGDSIPSVDPPDIYFVNKGEEAELIAMEISRYLRKQDFSVELDGSSSSFSKQFKRADRSGAQCILIIGNDEISRGEVRIKNVKFNGSEDELIDLTTPLNDMQKLISLIRS